MSSAVFLLLPTPCFVSCVQIITQLDHVFAIVYPPAYAKVVKVLNTVFHVFFGWLPVCDCSIPQIISSPPALRHM